MPITAVEYDMKMRKKKDWVRNAQELEYSKQQKLMKTKYDQFGPAQKMRENFKKQVGMRLRKSENEKRKYSQNLDNFISPNTFL